MNEMTCTCSQLFRDRLINVALQLNNSFSGFNINSISIEIADGYWGNSENAITYKIELGSDSIK